MSGYNALGLEFLSLLETAEIVLDEEGRVEFTHGDVVLLCK